MTTRDQTRSKSYSSGLAWVGGPWNLKNHWISPTVRCFFAEMSYSVRNNEMQNKTNDWILNECPIWGFGHSTICFFLFKWMTIAIFRTLISWWFDKAMARPSRKWCFNEFISLPSRIHNTFSFEHCWDLRYSRFMIPQYWWHMSTRKALLSRHILVIFAPSWRKRWKIDHIKRQKVSRVDSQNRKSEKKFTTYFLPKKLW